MADTAQSPASEYEQTLSLHAAYFAALMTREAPRLIGAGKADGGLAQRRALDLLRLELDNVFLALDTAMNRSAPDLLLALTVRLSTLLERTGGSFIAREKYGLLLGFALSCNCRKLALAASLGLMQAHAALSDYPAGREAAAAALRLAIELGDPDAEAESLRLLASLDFHLRDYDSARAGYEKALALWRQLGDRRGEAAALDRLGTVEYRQKNYAAAGVLLGQALALHRELGDRHGEAWSLCYLGNLASLQGSYNAARAKYEAALTLQRGLGDKLGEAVSLYNLGHIEKCLGNYGAARELLEQGLEMHRELGHLRGVAWSLTDIGEVDYFQENYSAARDSYREALELRHKLGEKDSVRELCLRAGAVLAALGRLHPAAVARYGALACQAMNRDELESGEASIRDPALLALDEAVASADISVADLDRWKVEGEALSMQELAEFTLAALAENCSAS